MKIYYLKYYKGNIAVGEHDVTQAPNHDYYLGSAFNDRVSFNKKDEGKVAEYSLGDIRIWITEKGSLELAHKKLNDYVENFHHKNIKMYRERVEQEGKYLSAFYEESMDAYLDGIYKYYNINKKKE